jgi:hypothetical protein
VFLYAFAIIFLMGSSFDAKAQLDTTHDSTFTKQGTQLTGTVVDSKTKGALAFASVTISQGGIIKAGAKTDLHGNFKIKPIAPGKYDLHVTYVGFEEYTQHGLVIVAGENPALNVIMGTRKNKPKIVGDLIICTKPLVDPSNPNQKRITREQLIDSPY